MKAIAAAWDDSLGRGGRPTAAIGRRGERAAAADGSGAVSGEKSGAVVARYENQLQCSRSHLSEEACVGVA